MCPKVSFNAVNFVKRIDQHLWKFIRKLGQVLCLIINQGTKSHNLIYIKPRLLFKLYIELDQNT